MVQFATILSQSIAGQMLDSEDRAHTALLEMGAKEREQLLKSANEEHARTERQQKAAAEERQHMAKLLDEERKRRDTQLYQTAVLSSNISIAAINSGGVVTSAGPAKSATIRSVTEATLISWLMSNNILAADSEWDAKALIGEGCTEGQDILLMDEKEWAAVGFKTIAIRKLVLLKTAAAANA